MTYTLHPDAPLDGDGYPIHPERGHHICGRGKSKKTTPTDHGRERDDVPYCMLAAGHGTTDPKRTGEPGVACTHHGGDSLRGKDNPNYKHGAYSKFPDFLFDDLPEHHRDAIEEIDFDEDPRTAAEMVWRDLIARYRRSRDDRFAREARQWAKDFGLIETPADKHEVEHSGEIDGTRTLELDEDAKEIARELIRRRQEEDADDE